LRLTASFVQYCHFNFHFTIVIFITAIGFADSAMNLQWKKKIKENIIFSSVLMCGESSFSLMNPLLQLRAKHWQISGALDSNVSN